MIRSALCVIVYFSLHIGYGLCADVSTMTYESRMQYDKGRIIRMQREITKGNEYLLRKAEILKDQKKTTDALFMARYVYAHSRDMGDKTRALLLIARIYTVMGKSNEAKRLYRQIIRNFPSQKSAIAYARKQLLEQ